MNAKEKTAVSRAIYAAVMIVLFGFLAVFCTILKKDSSFSAGLEKPDAMPSENYQSVSSSIDEPDFSYDRITLTFLGGIKAGSMLGSDSYGTLNALYSEMGADYFFDGLKTLTDTDDVTYAFCDSVFSDSDSLSPISDDVSKRNLAPASAADIFTSGGIDALSLEGSGVKVYGNDGVLDTKNAIEKSGAAWGNSGKAFYFEKSGLRVAVYPCTYRAENMDGIVSWIKNAAKNSDFVALMVSAEPDGGYIPDSDRETAFRSFIDAGAHLVAATDYTSPQRGEKYGDGYIAYSLGSLIDGSDRYTEKYSCALRVTVKGKNGRMNEFVAEPIPVCNYGDETPWQPYIVSENDSARRHLESFFAGEEDAP